MSQSRQLAAIMFTDIVGYTVLMGEDEEKAFELLEKNRSIQRPLIEEYNGRWLKEIGDGVLASFTTVSDAVYCAKAIQEACQQEDELKLRIGIHQGEVVFKGEDVFGDGVNIASRLEPLAPIGGILVSESVHRNLSNKKSIQSTFLGEVLLKNVREPIRTYSVQVEGLEPVVNTEPLAAKQQASPTTINPKRIALMSLAVIAVLAMVYFFFSIQSPDDTQVVQSEITDKSIAVLPFKNDSPDPHNQYFADGMMDEILNHLQKIAELGVKSRTAVEPYRNSTQSFGAIAQELDVAFVLEGAVRKYGDRFRVTTQLIEVASGNHLWSETYDGIFSDTIFVVQSNIAKKIAASLNAVITPQEESTINKIPTTDVAAYDLYIRGNHERMAYWQGGRDESRLTLAHNLFDEALKIDPNYLQAIIGKGETFSAESNTDSAFAYADRAIDLDPNFNKGYGLKGECYMRLGKSDLAIEYFLKAIDLPPKDEFWFWYHDALGLVYILQKNDLLKGLPYIKKGLETSIQFRWGYWLLANNYSTIGDYETANEYFQKGLERQPNNFLIRLYSQLLFAQGKYQEAFQFADSICQMQPDYSNCPLIKFRASLLLGEFEQAEQYYHQSQSAGSFGGTDYQIGYVYHNLGKTVEAEEIFAGEIQQLESDLANKQRNLFGVLTYSELLDLSRIHAFQGNKKQALEYLSEYAKRGFRDGQHDFILIDPFFESLRDDPEFKAIVKQAQEEKAAIREQVRQMEERGELTL